MIDVEVFGVALAPSAPPPAETVRLCERSAARRGIDSGHVAVEYVTAERMAQLNLEHRGRPGPTDVLSFPIDGVDSVTAPQREWRPEERPLAAPQAPPRELGDIVICPEHTADLGEAIVHGMLHLLGMDHETDDGEMLALQRELLRGAGR